MTSNRRDGERIGRERMAKERERVAEREDEEEVAAMAAWTEREPVPCGFR